MSISKLEFVKKRMRGVPLKEASRFPAMRNALVSHISTQLDEEDGLFIGYGLLPNPMPYTMQDCYETVSREMEFDSVVLENEYLRAEFMPQLGGRLWSLFDKIAGRDLLLNNPEFKPGNFAVRNAWPAGGVEWNVGRRGHDARTCSPLFVAVTEDEDGTPVLRMYEFNRDRAVTYQMDFFLPENSRFLLARMRLVNPNEYTVPMYWWSNIAVEERPGQRIVVPAMTSFANTYVSDSQHALVKVPLPFNEGIDCTYPVNHWNSKDHFFNIPVSERKYEAAIFADGYGVIQSSTDRLRGRKLFVWGQSPGGQHWQRKLMPEGVPDYLEIQAGLAQTQMECVPMPPKTAWEWLECYGAIQVEPSRISGDWSQAVSVVSQELERLMPRTHQDEILQRTQHSFVLKKAELISVGSGWGALEEKRRKQAGLPPLSGHLDFGVPGPEQEEWLTLLETGTMPEKSPSEAPASYIIQEEWFKLLLAVSREDWYTQYHRGLNYYQRGDFERAENLFNRSLAQEETVWVRHALANIYRTTGRRVEALAAMRQALNMCPSDESLAKEVLKTFGEFKDYGGMAEIVSLLPESLWDIPMIRFFQAAALAHQGQLESAEAILLCEGGLEIPDIREGENSISELYIFIQQEKARREGRTLVSNEIEVPFKMDLRMTQPKK